MRKCRTCKKEKEIGEFRIQRVRGYEYPSTQCKKCDVDKRREYRKKKPHLHRASNKKWRERNKDKHLKKIKQYKERIESKSGLGIATVRRFGFELAVNVYDRANRQCEECGEKKDLTIHHIDGKGRHNEEKGLEVNNDINNLKVLCRVCHGRIHGKEASKLRISHS